MSNYTRVYADINLDAIKENVRALMGATREGTKGIAVVKADAYGHGDVAVSKAIAPLVFGYAVATVEEAVNLRENGINQMILVLGYVDDSHYEAVISQGISIPVFDLDTAQQISDAVKEYNRREHTSLKARCHIKVDTGMRRIGLEPDETGAAIVRQITSLEGIDAEGIFTHFATADEEDKSGAYRQLERFQNFVRNLACEGITFRYQHSSNSAGIIEMPEANMDLVRMGIALYGMYPSDCVDQTKVKLTPALRLMSCVTMVKTVEAGEKVSYGGTFQTKRQTVLATVCIGYGDGYPRTLSNRGYVLIRGQKAKITGRVCMDQFMVDVTDIPGVARGDLVTLIGRDGNACITVEEIAELAGTFNYEFVCDLGKRIPRNYYMEGRLIGSRDYFHEHWNLKNL